MAGEPQTKRLRIAIEPHQEVPIKLVLDDGRIVYSTPKSQADKLFEVVKRLDFEKRGEDIEEEAVHHVAGTRAKFRFCCRMTLFGRTIYKAKAPLCFVDQQLFLKRFFLAFARICVLLQILCLS
jgi:hypothetical protein